MGKSTLTLLSGSPEITHPDRCSGCGRCIAACPEKLYSLEVNGFRKHLIKNPAKCKFCGKCIHSCLLDIIRHADSAGVGNHPSSA